MQFLIGLNENYSSTMAQILLIDPLPTIDNVFSLVAQEECQKSITHNILPSLTMTFNSIGSFDTISYSASLQPRFDQCPHDSRDRAYLVCTYCHLKGHTNDKCYKLHGYPIISKPILEIIK